MLILDLSFKLIKQFKMHINIIREIIPKRIKKIIFPIRIRRSLTALFYPTSVLGRAKFEGWGMASKNNPPSIFKDNFGKNFSKDNAELIKLIKSEKVILSQFGTIEKQLDFIEILQWRHYAVQCSLALQIEKIKNESDQIYIAEFGVCDGLTAWYAHKLLNRSNIKYQFNLFDSWSVMRSEDLNDSEENMLGSYDYLKIENTKKNLKEFSDKCNWIKGYLPDTLPKLDKKKQLGWMHIDLNSAKLTVDVLSYYLNYLSSGSLVLLDDYGHIGFSETRKLVDEWVNKNNNLVFLIVYPTGQGMIIWK